MYLRTVSYRAWPGWSIKPNSICVTKRRFYFYPETSQKSLKDNTCHSTSIFNSYATLYCPNIYSQVAIYPNCKNRESSVPLIFKWIRYCCIDCAVLVLICSVVMVVVVACRLLSLLFGILRLFLTFAPCNVAQGALLS